MKKNFLNNYRNDRYRRGCSVKRKIRDNRPKSVNTMGLAKMQH